VASKRRDHQSPPPIRSHRIVCGDCIIEAPKHLPDESVDLLICDPPFGIGEGKFCQQYNRKKEHVLPGYVEAPADYAKFTLDWMTQARRVLKPNGSLYVVIGFTNLIHVLNAAASLKLHLVNKIVWKYNFGVYTTRKYVTSHYDILYFTKSPKARPTFNRDCRLAHDARDGDGRSLQYRDREDVWIINRENHRGVTKNANKLPDALVEKIIAYSSNPGHIVGDFFLGNFTTATVAQRMKRVAIGFELNSLAFDHHVRRLRLSPPHRTSDRRSLP
jgi:site-specific DNA-methyltransferase (adenine-specific)